MTAPSIVTEFRKYRALAWAIVITLVVSVGLFIHFLQLDHSRAISTFSANAAHAATIGKMRVAVLIGHLETVGHDYLLMGASNIQLSGLMQALDVDTIVFSLCTREDGRARNLRTTQPHTATVSTLCTTEFTPSSPESQLHSTARGVFTDFRIVPSPANDGQSLEIRVRDIDARELRIVLNSTELLKTIALDNDELTMGSEILCLSVRIGGSYQELSCHVADAGLQTVDVDFPMQFSTATVSEKFEPAGLNLRLDITPRFVSLADEITALPFVMFGFSLAIGVVVCVFAFQAADKNILLETRADELESRLKQLDLLRERNSLLDQFAAMAAHDLQAPLRFIVSNAHLLILELEEFGQPELTKMATIQVEQGERMRLLVVDLLEFCRAGQSTLTIAPVDTVTIVDQEVRLLKMHAEYADTQINIGPLPDAFACDADKFKHIIRNILGNAVKFCQINSEPRVSISANRDTFHAPWTFRVWDNGPGVAIEHHERIFKPFARLDADTKGTGMGLAIVKIMIDRHGGSIWIDSGEKEGTTFCFTMPSTLPEGSLI